MLLLEIEHIGHEGGAESLAERQLLLGSLVNHGMLHVLQAGRKGHVEKIGNCIQGEADPLPVKVVMMGDCRHSRFGEKLGERHPQRQVHRDGEHVLGDQDIDSEPVNEAPQHGFKVAGHLVDTIGHFGRALGLTPDARIDPLVLGVPKEGFGNTHRNSRIPIAATTEPEYFVTHLLENLRPLETLQGDPVGPCKSGGNKTYPH